MGGGGFFCNLCDCPLCIRTGGYEGQFIFIFAQKVTKLQIHSHVKVNIGVMGNKKETIAECNFIADKSVD